MQFDRLVNVTYIQYYSIVQYILPGIKDQFIDLCIYGYAYNFKQDKEEFTLCNS